MKTVLVYIAQVIISSGILYGYYHFFLRNKQFHQYNRFYLIGAVAISLLVPFLQIPIYFSQQDPDSSVVLQTLQQLSSAGFEEEGTYIIGTREEATPFNWNVVWYGIYACISFILLLRIIVSLYKILVIKRRNPVEKLEGIEFISTSEPGTPFSFFSWLFWDKNIELKSPKGKQIFRHEVYHIQQKHSWDVLLMEFLIMIAWINPFFFLIKRELRAIHEFLADQFAVDEEEKWVYAELLLMQALQTSQSLANPFFHNQIKRRIAMITNPQKTSHRYLRKLLVLPVAAFVLTLFAFKYKQEQQPIEISLKEPMTIVIDAGHGGIDQGTSSPDEKFNEATLSLELAQAMKALAGEYNIRVVMTRETDELPLGATNKEDGLKNRLVIADEIKPDAFIALHVNAAGNTFQSTRSGVEAFVSGKRETTVDQQLATVILQELNQVYKTDMKVKSRPGTGIYVLDANKYPSVILQCGYITNKKDLEFFSNKANQDKIARSILQAVKNFKSSVETKNTSLSITASSTDTVPLVIEEKPLSIKIYPAENAQAKRGLTIDGLPEKDPLIIIDGKISKRKSKDLLKGIDPNNIESVTILKDAAAISQYGEAGKNGVILIELKSALTEVVVEGYPTKKVTGVQIQEDSKNEEVVVQGYPSKKTTGTGVRGEVKEVVVEGYPTKGNNEEKEIIVEGYPTRKKDTLKLTEVTVTGYPTSKIKEQKEVVVVGYGTELPEDQEPIFKTTEIDPMFAGGEREWSKYLERNLNGNLAVENGAPKGKYTVRIKFIVNKDGSISQLQAMTNHGYGMEAEVMRVLKAGPKWRPAIQNGKEVRAWRIQPVTFQVERSKPTT